MTLLLLCTCLKSDRLCACITCTIGLQAVPNVAVEVVIASEQQAATLGESN